MPSDLLALIDRAHAEQWTELDLSGMGLTELPPEIGKLTGLKNTGEGGSDLFCHSHLSSKRLVKS